ncbi:J domain-containing protein [Spiroplasma alleghenense]|uniref:J domain-containing protein n=1 Tax=Spiroplasma alleghenense TaxID=216931 RepID=A0A345Z316_9MOLU|nr:J domain-containing protein [Spiroplasma alleghenense]AXK50995.1 hypothetical protein SALLE_v1c03210 [Spiroplasma alleghenense]
MDDIINLIFRILYFVFFWWLISLIFNHKKGRRNKYNTYDDESTYESEQEQEFSRVSKSKLQESYEVLGVDPDISDKELKKTYLNLAKKYHPDNSEDKEANEIKMTRINSAYQFICETRGIRK